MRPKEDHAGRGGFTLVEIMIAIAILGILITIAITDFRGLNEKYKVEAETKQIYADLMDARGRAMQRNRWFFVLIAPTGYGYATFEDGPLPDGDSLPNGNDNMVTNATVRHLIHTDPVGKGSFGFNRSGIANDNLTIWLETSVNPDYDCITINPTRIKMGEYVGGNCVEK